MEAAITTTHLHEFANRPLDTLSGGQRQRAWFAMALPQDTETLLLDLLYQLNRQGERTIVMVLYNLNILPLQSSSRGAAGGRGDCPGIPRHGRHRNSCAPGLRPEQSDYS